MNRDVTITQTDVTLRRNDRPIELTRASAEIVAIGVAGSQGAKGDKGDTGTSGVAAATAPVTLASNTVGLSTGAGLTTSAGALVVDFGSTASKVTQGNDSRLTDARTPTAHASTHASGGSDAVLTPAQVGSLYTYGHSYGRGGAGPTGEDYTYQRLLAQWMHASIRDRHMSGTILLGSGVIGCRTPMLVDPPETVSTDRNEFGSRRGTAIIVTGVNDLTFFNVDNRAQWITAMVAAWKAQIAHLRLASFWCSTLATSNTVATGSQTFTGSWTSTNYSAGFELGPGPGRRFTYSSAATWIITPPSSAAGKIATLFFLTNRTGGSIPSSTVTITTTSGTKTIDTNNVNPSTTSSILAGVAAVQVTIPAGTTTITVTSSGGMSVCGWGVDAERPVLVAPIVRLAGHSSDQLAVIVDCNAALSSMIASDWVSTLVRFVDIDTALNGASPSINSANFNSADAHPNNRGHEIIARSMRDALLAMTFADSQRIYA